MPGERYVDLAHNALFDHVAGTTPNTITSAPLVAQLRLVETAQGLAANTIENPVEFLRFFAPMRKVCPSIQIYPSEGAFDHAIAGQRNHRMGVDLDIAVVWNIGLDGSNAHHLYKYITAIIEMFENTPSLVSRNSLGNRYGVSKTKVNNISFGNFFGPDENVQRLVGIVKVTVDCHNPT